MLLRKHAVVGARHREPGPKRAFLRAFLRNPREVGSVIPSSRFLAHRLVRAARAQHAKLVVELGAGTGAVTRVLLRVLPPHGRLLAIEINPELADFLRRSIDDPRLLVHAGSAEDLAEILAKLGLHTPDVIVSGIPFSTMDRAQGRKILQSARSALAPTGRFVTYQVRNHVETIGSEVMGKPTRHVELRNIPPVRVYTWIRREEEVPELRSRVTA
jgi:phospholipid N-methyltransferase